MNISAWAGPDLVSVGASIRRASTRIRVILRFSPAEESAGPGPGIIRMRACGLLPVGHAPIDL
jgi:hypothetical protein